ncbi:MAG: histone deacetylase family protein [Candidatus Pacebacteria bacterium]|nr:histone deacetylase family protein [Candidatus Paceibacterota bacterium]PIR60118.1 MAG: histone deacetylase family protein [Candidatus Pacebacteria bacterium CG10_big_fil_rev_8_21_14_0_10_45_6]
MNIYYPRNHQLHHPQTEFFNGEMIPHSEVPSRLENILSALEGSAHTLLAVDRVTDFAAIWHELSQIHSPEYLVWLWNTQVLQAVYPSVFSATGVLEKTWHQSIQWGRFVTDIFTPLLPHTWEVATTTAQCIFMATNECLQNRTSSLVLARPPGHHAGRSRAGGYCYLNNAAFAAQILSKSGRVAILDVDFHHGNGTQDIFYDRDDVVTCSIHADPRRKFPYFAGYEAELGVGNGVGYNRNFPLAAGITDTQYQPLLEEALAWIAQFEPKFLIVSLGLDTHESDPIADFALTTGYYQTMAKTISGLGLPQITVLEGGYSTTSIGENMVSFLGGARSIGAKKPGRR